MSPRKLAAFCASVLSVALLAGCGSDDSDDAVEDPSSDQSSTSTAAAGDPTSAPPVALPACDKVWRKGATLPGDYDGCTKGGKDVEAEGLDCSSGQVIVRFADRFWAVPGGRIHRSEGPLLRDSTYKKKLAVCRG